MRRLWNTFAALVTLVVVLCCGQRLTGAEATAVDPVETYAEAHRVTAKTGKPMLIMVCADWCVPCQKMRKGILPQNQRPRLRNCATAAPW
jgi:thiol:disulfide interchange protein